MGLAIFTRSWDACLWLGVIRSQCCLFNNNFALVNEHMNYNCYIMEILLPLTGVQHHHQICILQDIAVLKLTCYTRSLCQVRSKRQKSQAPVLLRWGDGLLACRSCALVEEWCPHVQEPWEEVSRLHSIRDEKGIDQSFSEILQRQKPEPPHTPKEGQAESVLIRLGNGDSRDAEG